MAALSLTILLLQMKLLFRFAAEAFASANATHPGCTGEQQAKLTTICNKVLAALRKRTFIAQYP